MSRDSEVVDAAFDDLAEIFAVSADEDKFQALQSLCFIVTTFGEREQGVLATNKASAVHIRNGLFDVLRNRISKEYMQDTLYLARWMLQSKHFGGVWALAKPQFPLLLLQTCRTEICLHLGGYERKNSDITPEDDGPIIIRSQDDQKLLINCYHIIESSIYNLVVEVDDKEPCWSSLPSDVVMNIQKIFYDVFDVVVQFLTRLTHSKQQNESFIYATFKLFAIWSAEDPERYKTDFLQLIPFFLSLNSKEDKEQAIEESTALELLIPPLSALEAELSTETSKIIFPHLISFLKNWISQHPDLTDILSDTTAYQSLLLVETIAQKSENLETQIPPNISQLLKLLQSFQQ